MGGKSKIKQLEEAAVGSSIQVYRNVSIFFHFSSFLC